MLLMTIPSDRLTDFIVFDEILERIERILNEFRNRNKLQKYGLMNRRKIAYCNTLRIELNTRHILFPERIVRLGKANKEQLKNLISMCDYISEIR